jgi:hypothetical protein
VILAGALMFGLPTLLIKQFQDPDATVPRLLRGFAGGVIVALALVHIVPSVSATSSAPSALPTSSSSSSGISFVTLRSAAALPDLQPSTAQYKRPSLLACRCWQPSKQQHLQEPSASLHVCRLTAT